MVLIWSYEWVYLEAQVIESAGKPRGTGSWLSASCSSRNCCCNSPKPTMRATRSVRRIR